MPGTAVNGPREVPRVAAEADVRGVWLVRLRWGAVIGQTGIVVAAAHGGLVLPLAELLGLTLLLAISNAVLHSWVRGGGRAISNGLAGGILAFDMAQLTALLHVTGGAANPFSVFYLVYITAAAATLGSRWTWLLTAFGVSAYAALFALPGYSRAAVGSHAAHDFARHLRAMWVALTLAAALTAFFVTRLTTSLARRDRQLAAMRDAAARRERLSALTTLAAGAAHELATPLTTVAVAAGELERTLASLPEHERERLADDVRLVRAEVTRCREILDEIGASSGNACGEMPARFTADDLLCDVLGRLRPALACRVRAEAAGGPTTLFLPRHVLGRVVLSLVENALDASPAGERVSVAVSAAGRLEVRVRDQGVGIPSEVLARVGEPFVTTKGAGEGLGLGLYLARSLADQLGGRLVLDSTPGCGTTAVLTLPAEVRADVQPA